MTITPAHEIYPQYCFHKSPTITAWCRLRTSDIAKLWSPPGFEGQDVFFYNNHPIKWVRIAGVVVAVDEYTVNESTIKRVYTVDDSSGINVECIAQLAAKQPKNISLDAHSPDLVAQQRRQQQQQQQSPFDLDVGQVVEIRGGLKLYRTRYETRLQINIEKVKHLSTQHEVDFWKEVVKLHDETLSRPWVLDERVLRHCRRKAEKDELQSKKKKRPEKASDSVSKEPSTREAVNKASEGKGHGAIHHLRPPAVPQFVSGLEKKRRVKNTYPGDGLHHRHGGPSTVAVADSAVPKLLTGLERKRRQRKAEHGTNLQGRSMSRA
ncbi:OB-fold nucleic acid binding domain-containing protein [Gaeumannomyces tritici R3-111a-1]|uniref:OB-fold nucleic acid binding domain-containing protein n=1 Tax=Gaeumannomyces tritici (strain R3-111a-1) TaxID=644352 RepID=J3NG07_GAET3|nr:OB-fold nucleic acid binding domain-containing protein [Gaeumannomyces tritici R3-111a-1]EJT80197.1 OB-fold nucleic acid binding domain-containing protein [Gaeumannomyces tritici R3-111a-1]